MIAKQIGSIARRGDTAPILPRMTLVDASAYCKAAGQPGYFRADTEERAQIREDGAVREVPGGSWWDPERYKDKNY